MALSVTVEKRDVKGSDRVHRGFLNLGAYATGGIAYTPQAFGFGSKIAQLRLQQVGVLAGAPKLATVDETNSKIQAWSLAAAPAAEVANATDLSAMVLRFEATGL